MASEQAPARGHRKLSLALIVLGAIVALVAIFSIWANRQALNTDNWVNTSDRILADEEVEARLSAYIADQLFANVDVKAELEAKLPPDLKALAGPAAGGLSQLAPKVAERLLASPRVQALWSDANRAAHETLLKLLDGGSGAISTEGGKVTLDLGDVLQEVGGQLGVGEGLAAKLPPEAGQLTILRSDQISTAQDIAKLIRTLPVVLTLLALLLFGLAIWQAGPRRRQALRSVGIAFIVAGALALVLRSVAGHAIVNSLVANEANEAAVEAVWSIGTSLLATIAGSAIAFGVLVFLAAWLAGPTQAATALRRGAAPYVRDQPLASALAAFLLWLALVAWVPIAAFDRPLGILLFAILFAAGAELLRRQTLREFPDAEAADLGAALRARFRSRSERSATPRAEQAGVATEVEQLERLSALHASGALTAEEFQAAKASVIAERGASA
ncbi:MAG: SHOCT domain-containing protein [Solirubrobacterales bacterium]